MYARSVSSPATRRAVVLTDFGSADNLAIRELPVPALRPDQMLVRVHATSVNPIEWKMRSGLLLPKPVWRRLLGSPIIPGLDFSGTVAACGPDVLGFQIGEDVMGAFPLNGGYAEYVVVRPADRLTAVARKPAAVSHIDAASTSFAGLVALAGLTTHGGLAGKPNPRVLVIGASGGVGRLAVQLARHGVMAGLVVGVCSSRNEPFVLDCGAHEVVPYDRTPIESIPEQRPEWRGTFDLIVDAVGLDHVWTGPAQELLAPNGRFVGAGLPQTADGRPGEEVTGIEAVAMYAKLAVRRTGGRYRFIYGLFGDLPTKRGYRLLVRWLAEGKVRARVAATYPLDQLADAHRASETGRTVGKIAITVP